MASSGTLVRQAIERSPEGKAEASHMMAFWPAECLKKRLFSGFATRICLLTMPL